MGNVIDANKWWRRPPFDNTPPGPPAMEARVARLEAVTEHIQKDVSEIKQDVREMRRDMRTDFRLMFGALITAALGLAGLMAKGFGWL